VDDDGGMDFGYRETVLRPRFGQGLAVVVAAICAFGLVGFALRGDGATLLRAAAPLALTGFGSYALFWAPRVRITPADIELVNPLRTIRITWPAVEDIETRWSLVVTAGKRRYPAWAAPREGGVARVRPGSRPGSMLSDDARQRMRANVPEGALAGAIALRQWQEYRDRGLLGVVEGQGVTVRVHVVTAAVLLVLAVGTLASASIA
jgi:hypothetical protein